MRLLLPSLLVVTLASASAAQCSSLTTTFAANNGQSGNMFDVSVTVPAILDSVSINADTGLWDVEIWAVSGGGTHVGSEQTPGDWTLLGTAIGVQAINGVPTEVPITLGVTVQPGQLQGIYVTVTNGTAINYTNGTAVGNVAASDAFLTINEGTGNAYPFLASFMPRIWNGTLEYSIISTLASHELNDAESSLSITGVETTGCFAPTSVACIGNPVPVDFASIHAGMPYEVGLALAGTLPNVGSTPAGQIINLQLTHPSLGFLNGGAVPSFTTPFPGPFTISFDMPSLGFTLSMQMLNFSPTHADGFALSQAPSVSSTFAVIQAGPEGDEEVKVLQIPPLCGPPSVEFYGISYTEFWVSTNGRVGFDTPTMDFTASPAEAASGAPFIGFWSDLETGSGSITAIGLGPDFVRVSFSSVAYRNEAPAMGYFVELHANGAHRLTSLASIPANPVSTPFAASADRQFLGMSAGASGNATDPGPVTFLPGTSGGPAASTDMIYDWWDAPAQGLVPALVPSLSAGLSSLVFSAAPGGGYTWTAF